MKRLPPNQRNYAVRRERDSHALLRLALLLVCGLVLAGGFVYAAGQHFTAVQYGYKSEELRREQAGLLEEQRRLMLERERAATPEHLDAAAREIGMQPIQPAQIDPARNFERTQMHSSPALVSPATSLGR
jgi:cell division protein FtsL